MRKKLAALCAGLLTIGIVPVISLATAPSASALANGLALTPPIGWNDWNGYQCNNTATDVEQTALYIHTSGLQAAGYKYVNNDGCWDDMVGLGSADPSGHTLTSLPAEACGAVNGRLPGGEIFINTTEFPPSSPCANDGFKIVANYVHSLGLKFGLYLNASNNWNGEEIPGSYGFDQEDANTFASWGVDYVKADWGVSATTVPPANDPLGGPTFGTQPLPLNLSQLQLAQLMYGALGQALAATGRPIVYSIAGAGVPSPQDWGGSVANLVRPAGDSAATFASLLTIINTDDQYAADQHPGAWIDPDIMEVGNGMTRTEDQSEMSMFAELGSPLLMSTNLVNPAGGVAQQAQNLSIFGNKDVIAIDQDTLGKMGTLLSSANGLDVFAKPLANGDTAVALFNTTTIPSTISTTAAAVGMASPLSIYTLKDLWSKQVTETAGTISAFVPAHGTVLYRVSKTTNPLALLGALLEAPNTTLGVSADTAQLNAGTSATVTETLTNNAVSPVGQVELGVKVPTGWTATQVSPAQSHRLSLFPSLLTGQRTTAVFKVTAPATAPPISAATLSATASYSAVSGKQASASSVAVTLVSPVASPYLTANTTGTPASFGETGGTFAVDAAGAGIAAASSRGAAVDQYGAIYLPGGADGTAVAQTTVSADANVGRNAKTGILERNDATASASSPEGVALYFTGSAVGMSWAASGGAFVDTTSAQIAGITAPVQLRLTRAGVNYTGYYSLDGSTWVQVATATLPAVASNPTQDVGIFTTSATAGAPGEADFGGLTVTS